MMKLTGNICTTNSEDFNFKYFKVYFADKLFYMEDFYFSMRH